MRRAARIATIIAGAGVLTLSAGAAVTAAPPPGLPDASFGAGGLARTPFGAAARGSALALGPDGSITVAGDVRRSAGEAALVARFTSGGVLDASFAGSGSRFDRFGARLGAGSHQRAEAVAVAPDGSTIVAGVAGSQIMVARYGPDGELDGRFGAGGVVLRDLADGAAMPPDGGLAAIALAPDGQILVAGSIGIPADDPYGDGEAGERVVVGRLSDRGVPDPSFGRDGFAVEQLGARSARRPARSRATALALGPGGTIVLAGRSSAPNGADRALVARLTSAGRLDSAFGRAGRVVLQLGHGSAARPARSALHALTLGPDGSALVAGGATDVAGNGQVVLARLTAAGRLDTGYGRAGVVRTQVSGASGARVGRPESLARAIAPTADGNVLVSGSSSLGGAFTLRTTGSGRLDCGYGTLGRGAAFSAPVMRPGDPATDGAFGVLAQPDGRYVATGRLPGGGLLLGRVLGGAAAAPQPPARRPGLRTLGARYLGNGRAVIYGAVLANCSAATTVRFVAAPSARATRGRAITTRFERVSGAYGIQSVCAIVRGLRPGRTYRVRIEARQAAGATRSLRAVPAGRRTLPQEGCA